MNIQTKQSTISQDLFWAPSRHRDKPVDVHGFLLMLVLSAAWIAALLPGVAHAQDETPNRDRGVLVAAVHEGSPAAKAGVVRGDILMAINDEPVDLTAELVQMLGDLAPESEIELSVLHGDDLRTLSATLGARGAGGYLGIVPCCDASPAGAGAVWIGADPAMPPFSPPGLPGDFTIRIDQPGVIITEVLPDSPAAMAGLQAGDQIIAVDEQSIDADHALADLIAAHKPGDEVMLEVQRGAALFHPQKETESAEATAEETHTETEQDTQTAESSETDSDAVGDQAKPLETEVDDHVVIIRKMETETIMVTLGENPADPESAFLGVHYADGFNARQFADGPMAENHFFARPFNGRPFEWMPHDAIPFGNPPFGDRPFGQYRFFRGAPHSYNMPGAEMDASAVIMQVLPDSPAAEAGLQEGEIIVALNGEPLTDPTQLKEQITQLAPGDEIVLTVRQPGETTDEPDIDADGAEREVTIALGENEQGDAWLGVQIGLSIRVDQTESTE